MIKNFIRVLDQALHKATEGYLDTISVRLTKTFPTQLPY
jgi:hypothetical protein